MSVLYAFLILTGLGVILCIGLNYVDKKLSIKKDEKLVDLENCLPGANCGGCGFNGCSDYAKAVYEGTAKPGLCTAGGQKTADAMGKILGLEVSCVEKQVACVFCNASCNDTAKDYDYNGLEDCNAANMLFGGNSSCKEGCLHLLSCMKVCEQGAISVDQNKNIVVDAEKCIGCGKCTSVCPHHVIKLIPVSTQYIVKCNNTEKGGDVRKHCEKGCIGCKICEIKFPASGIKVNNNLASVVDTPDIEALKSSADICPRKVIVKVR